MSCITMCESIPTDEPSTTHTRRQRKGKRDKQAKRSRRMVGIRSNRFRSALQDDVEEAALSSSTRLLARLQARPKTREARP